MLSIQGLSKRFGGLQAVKEVDVRAQPGDVTAIIGPNGAGKSTLMNLVSGFVPPDAGSVTVNGTSVAGLKPHQICRHGVARTFQNLQMFSDMSVVEAVVTGRARHQRTSLLAAMLMTPRVWQEEQGAITTSTALLRTMEIDESYWRRRAGDLPYGIQRRVEIARALATEPSYLLLDEPAAGLNDDESAALGETLGKLAGAGIGVVLIEHDIDLVMRVSRHIFVMDAGTVIASGTPEAVRTDPQVVAAYLGDEHA